jgi:hypothetical protein
MDARPRPARERRRHRQRGRHLAVGGWSPGDDGLAHRHRAHRGSLRRHLGVLAGLEVIETCQTAGLGAVSPLGRRLLHRRGGGPLRNRTCSARWCTSEECRSRPLDVRDRRCTTRRRARPHRLCRHHTVPGAGAARLRRAAHRTGSGARGRGPRDRRRRPACRASPGRRSRWSARATTRGPPRCACATTRPTSRPRSRCSCADWPQTWAATPGVHHGSIELHPNLVNVVPARARLTADMRNTDEALLCSAEERLAAFCDEIAVAEGVDDHHTAARPLRAGGVRRPGGRARRTHRRRRGLRVRRLPSGAGHDAQMLARGAERHGVHPRASGGISHNPAEHTEPGDLAAGADVLLQVAPHHPATAAPDGSSDDTTLASSPGGDTCGTARGGPIDPATTPRRRSWSVCWPAPPGTRHGCDLVVFPELALTTFFPAGSWTTSPRPTTGTRRPCRTTPRQPLFDEARQLGIGFCLGYAELTGPDATVSGTGTTPRSWWSKDGQVVGATARCTSPATNTTSQDRPFQHAERYYFEPGPDGPGCGGLRRRRRHDDLQRSPVARELPRDGPPGGRADPVRVQHAHPLRARPQPGHPAGLPQQPRDAGGRLPERHLGRGVAKAGVEEGVDSWARAASSLPAVRSSPRPITTGDELLVARCDLDWCAALQGPPCSTSPATADPSCTPASPPPA